jgi:hypothetical protein
VKAGAAHVLLWITARQRSVLTLTAPRKSSLRVSAKNTATRYHKYARVGVKVA